MADTLNTQYDPQKHRRRSIRLKEYDYSPAGAYFVTVCAKGRRCVLADIRDGNVVLSPVAEVVHQCGESVPNHFRSAKLDLFVVMPNHLHAILILNGRKGVQLNAPTKSAVHAAHARAGEQSNFYSSISPGRKTLSVIIRTFKAAVTTQCRQKHYHFVGWQRNYYEHIIRDQNELNRIREYLMNNPLQWQFDRENPARVPDRSYDNRWGHLLETIYGKTKR